MSDTRPEDIIDMFENQVEIQSNKIAIHHLEACISYQELNEKANQLARYLISLGVTKGSLVAICIEQSINRPLFILAIIKAGAAWLPLDPEHPEARLALILQDTQSAFLLASAQTRSKFTDFQGHLIAPDEPDHQSQIALQPRHNLALPLHATDLAYVIFTSGSTGIPKGVAIDHGAIFSFFTHYPQVTHLTDRNVVIQLSAYTFDASFIDLCLPLLLGATLFLYPDNRLLGAPLLEFIKRHRIDTIAMITPTVLASLPTDEPIGDLKHIGVGGEVCPENVFRYWVGKVNLFNVYGPTETTIAVCCHKFQPGHNARTIGMPLPGVEFQILDEQMQPVEPGENGQLFVSGSQLAQGYLHREALTAERFPYVTLANAASAQSQTLRMYKTGDIVKQLPDGNLEFIGRNDSQLKVRGFRIEAGEIEYALGAINGVKEAAVVAINADLGQPILAAFITTDVFPLEDELEFKAQIRLQLQRTLPSYMVPEKFVFLEQLPLTTNGKLDKKRLKLHNVIEKLSIDEIAEDDVEGLLTAIWQHVLQTPGIKPTDNFFEIGGHSLGVTRVLAALPTAIKQKFKVVDLYLNPTIETLAAEIRSRRDKTPLSFEERMKISTDILLNDIKLDADYDYPTEIDPAVLAAPSKILLTGSTGFVGIHLLLELLATTSADIYCLIRAENAEHALERVKFTLKKYRQPCPDALMQRVKPIIGDFTLNHLGMEQNLYTQLANDIEIIYHTGGNVNYIKPYSIMKSVNVDGMQQIIRFATTEKLKYLVACSTIAVYSWGHTLTGKTWMREDDELSQNLPTVCRDTNYVRSKWVMENILEKAKQKGLPVIGIRLGFIICHSQTGATEMNQWWGSMVRCCITLGTYPMIMGLKDQLVTVDFVAKAIAHISKNKDAPGKFFHLAPDPVLDMTVPGFFVKMNDLLGLNLVPAHYHEWLNMWKDNENSPMYSLLSLYTDEVVPGRSLVEVYEMSYYFDRSNTVEFLKGSGIETPRMSKEIFTQYLDYMGINLSSL